MYLQEFKNKSDIESHYSVKLERGTKVLLAWYGYGDYCGSSFVLFEKGGQLYEVNGSHCSCNGLEGQWEPEPTTVKALKHVLDEGDKFYNHYDGHDVATKALKRILNSLTKKGYN